MSVGSNRLTTKREVIRACLAASALTACLAGTALGQGGGGVQAPDPASIADVTCAVRCLDLRTVAETGRIEISGTGLESTVEVRFPAAEGKLEVEPRTTSDDAVIAPVPVGADSGRISVVSEYGAKAAAPVEIVVKPASAIDEVEGFAVTEAEAAPAKSYFNGKRQAGLRYLFEADNVADVRIDVIEERTGTAVDTIIEKDQKPFANHSIHWDGLGAGNRIPPSGDYRFRVSPLTGGAGAAAGFSYYDHIFPLRARKHGYGDGLGAGRNHQGQDIFAKCGTRVVAARGGVVQTQAYHSAAGNYVVIDGRKTGNDYAYMHLEGRGLARKGSRVRTGELIGYESDTGNASGCHLHFELWSAPGWYEGGKPLNPTAPLKKWDGWS